MDFTTHGRYPSWLTRSRSLFPPFPSLLDTFSFSLGTELLKSPPQSSLHIQIPISLQDPVQEPLLYWDAQLTLMFLSLELLTFSYCSVQKRIDRAGLMQLSLEKPACEVGHWMVSRSLQSKKILSQNAKSVLLCLDCLC